MLKKLLNPLVFLAGLGAVCWIAVGYIGTSALALSVSLLIAACYLAGGFELHRYRQATATLAAAVADLSAPPARLEEWLQRLHASLRPSVRLRIEGERAALPAPALAPYLVGLLVLLGMLGTLLGMMVTLRGTGTALQSAADLQAVRASLAAPVAGLGFAFGTSIAGVAASAMLGLLSALARRERAEAAQALDAAIGAGLRVHSQAHQREETFKLLQRQAEAMPRLVDRLEAMVAAMEQHSQTANERLDARQAGFNERTEAAYLQLAASVRQSLQDSVAENARVAGAALQPVVESTLAAVARETAGLHQRLDQAAQRQAEGLAAAFAATAGTVTEIWSRAAAEHERTAQALVVDMRSALEQSAHTLGQGAGDLLAALDRRLEASAGHNAQAWQGLLAQQTAAQAALAERNEQALAATAASLDTQAAALVRVVQHAHGELQAALAAGDQARLAAWSGAFEQAAASVGQQWRDAGEQAAQRQQAICDTLAQTAQTLSAQAQRHGQDTLAEVARLVEAAAAAPQAAAAVVADFQAQSSALVSSMQRSHEALQAALEERDSQRLGAWSAAFGELTAALGERWERAGEQAASRQQAICETLSRTAADISSQTQAQARDTIGEIARLVDAASEAPRAAAEVVAELRQKLSDSMVRDTAMLEERGRLLATLETLLDAVNHASTEQRSAVDALVATSAGLLDRVGTRFTEHVQAETGKLGAVAAQVEAGAVDVASLGEAFAGAVQVFGQASQALAERLQGVEAALDKSLARSDEQLAYYVAQAREVVDLSVLAQKQVIEEIGLLAERSGAGAQAA